jgi:group I intron endonuclease
MIVYKATFPNGKSYIGQTSQKFNTRKRGHIFASKNLNASYDYNVIFHQAIRKYGEDNIQWTILEDGITDSVILDDREIYWVSKLNTKTPNGYNMADGGKSIRGYKHREDSKNKMSISRKGRIITPEWRKKLSESTKGRKKPQSFIDKMTGRKQSPERIEKSKGRIPWNKGKHGIFKEEAKNKMRLSRLGYHLSEEEKEYLRKTMQGNKSCGLPGSKHPFAIRYKLIDPSGIEYTIHGILKYFTKEHNLSIITLRKNVNKGKINSSLLELRGKYTRNTQGWEIIKQ